MATDNTESGLASSMTDLMTSLAVIFILLLVASLNNSQQEGETTRNLILAKLKQKMEIELVDYKDQGFEIKNDPKGPLGLIVVVPEGLLNFQLGKSDVPEKGIKFLDTILPKMASTICSDEFRRDIGSMVVEGHTDSSGNDDMNLPLSQARSMAVVRESLKVLGGITPVGSGNVGDTALRYRSCFLDLLSATGRGSVEPVLTPKGDEDRDRSRRVIFKIRVRSLEEKLIKGTLGTNSAENAGK
jgi:outer membrane protein OmpA-like peptidoglycan-associated protein